MKKCGIIAACALVLSACGGGSGSGQEKPLITSASWLVGSSLTYQETSLVSGNNTLNTAYRVTYGVAAADGSHTVTRQDLSASNTVNGLRFGGLESVSNYDGQGRLLRTTNRVDGGPATVCQDSSSRVQLPKPLLPDSTWAGDWTRTCGSLPPVASHLRLGHVVGTETVSVPAGTYEAVHVYEELDTTSTAVPYTQHNVLNVWYDRASGMKIKSDSAMTYSNGTPAGAHASHITDQLTAVQKGS